MTTEAAGALPVSRRWWPLPSTAMRQFFSVRFLAAVGAVLLLAGIAVLVARGDDDLGAVLNAAPRARRADLISSVAAIQRGDDFEMTSFGTVGGTLILDLPIADRIVRMQVFPGTPGQIDCQALDQPFRCAVIAELLADSIVSFRLVPVGVGLRVELPAIVGFGDGYAQLADGWEVRYVPVIDRSACETEVAFASFTELRSHYGTDFVSVYDLAEDRIVSVKDCGARAGAAA